MPSMTNMAPIKKSVLNCSPKNSDPKIIPNIGAKKAKLATLEAGYTDNSQNHNPNPAATTIDD